MTNVSMMNETKHLETRLGKEQEEKFEDYDKNILAVCNAIADRIKDKVEKVASGFVLLNHPLLTKNKCKFLQNILREKPPNTYTVIQKILSNPEDKFHILFNFIFQQRQYSQKRLGNFGRMVSYTEDAEGSNVIMGQFTCWMGVQVSKTTLQRDKNKHSESYQKDLTDLQQCKNVLIIWDNFQNFTSMKYLQTGQ